MRQVLLVALFVCSWCFASLADAEDVSIKVRELQMSSVGNDPYTLCLYYGDDSGKHCVWKCSFRETLMGQNDCYSELRSHFTSGNQALCRGAFADALEGGQVGWDNNRSACENLINNCFEQPGHRSGCNWTKSAESLGLREMQAAMDKVANRQKNLNALQRTCQRVEVANQTIATQAKVSHLSESEFRKRMDDGSCSNGQVTTKGQNATVK